MVDDLQLQQHAQQKARKAAGSHDSERLDSVLGFIARKAGSATRSGGNDGGGHGSYKPRSNTLLVFVLVTLSDLP